jgi:hypothetical protein
MREKKHGQLIRLTAVVFLAAVLFPAFATPQDTPTAPRAVEKQAARGGLRGSLGLTPDQEKALQDLRQARMKEREAFRGEMARLRAERNKIFTPEQLEKLKALRSRVAGRAALAGRGTMGGSRLGLRGPGRILRPGPGLRRMARLRFLRQHPFFRWRRW